MLKLRRGLSSFFLARPVLENRLQNKKSSAAPINVTNAVITTARTTVFLLLCLSAGLDDGGAETSATAGGVSLGKNDDGDKGGCKGLGTTGAGADDGARPGPGDGARLGPGDGAKLGPGDGGRLGAGDPTVGPGLGDPDIC